MTPPVSEGDWPSVDNWWGSLNQERQLILYPSHIRQMGSRWKEESWKSVDTLWDAFKAGNKLTLVEEHIRELENGGKEDAWTAVDGLWDSYAEQQQTELLELQKLMARLSDVWTNGASKFDSDPLTTNWRPESQYEGPLRVSIEEEDWSQWLAHLLRTSTGPFVQALLGAPIRSPDEVRREVVFSDGLSTRRIDILVEYEDTAVSIEVKNGDTNYGKTPDTARLIERDDDREWSHILLLQKGRLQNLRQTFGEDLHLSEEGNPTIQSEHSANIDVCYWRDVSRLLRQMLINGREPDSHWEASAYLFITLIEQRVLKLHSFSFVDPTAATDPRTTAATDLHRLIAIEPEAQIDYLRSVLQEDHKHE